MLVKIAQISSYLLPNCPMLSISGILFSTCKCSSGIIVDINGHIYSIVNAILNHLLYTGKPGWVYLHRFLVAIMTGVSSVSIVTNRYPYGIYTICF
ncbi:hypothetical protein GALL_469590 [mine drainage metagenome]|uniref:Uncharacterized protein n=1 Tax=mine drainage metagenome TaxID=410659 RepID=A0A1J5PKT4_9ZZZZ